MVLVTMGLFFVILTTFTVMVLLFSNDLLVQQEEETIMNTLSLVQEQVSEIDKPLTKEQLIDYLQNNQTVAKPHSKTVLTESMALSGNHSIAHLLYSNQIVYLYDIKKKVIFTTGDKENPLSLGPLGTIRSEKIGADRGATISIPLFNQAGSVIGYAKLFHNLAFYDTLKNRLVVLLVFLEVGTIMIVLIIMRYSIKTFLRPIYSLRHVMRRIQSDPTDLTVRAQISSGDEIEELSHIFNGMMSIIAEQNTLQQQFISDVSHELRTPVAVIKGHLDMLSRWGKNDPEILEESLEASRHEAQRMTVMISEMLDLVRLQGHLSDKSDEVTCLEASMQTSLYNFEILRPDFQFILDIKRDGIRAKIAKGHFEQILTILIDNAIKYSPKTKVVALSLTKNTKEALVTVTDQGDGIDQADLEHIFERFYRTDKSRSREGTRAGLGIGLSLLKQISDAYNCRLSVDSTVDVGTRFVIAIPLADPSPTKPDLEQ